MYKGTYRHIVTNSYGHRRRESGKKVGEWVEYYENGQMSSSYTYDNDGAAFGEWIEYHQNGQIKMTGKYIDGVKHGQWITYYDNGNYLKLETWKKGKKDGVWFECYDSKKFMPFAMYFLKSNQLLKSKEYWDDDIQHGKWMYYDENGKKKKKMVYENGVLVKEKEY